MPDNNLHSINKLQDDIKAAKWLSVFLPKKKRQQIKELETSLANMIHLIESFNKYFSDAGWCAYDSMNMPLMENAVKAYEAGGIDAGEQVLIQYYQTDVKDIMHWLKNKAKPFRERYELIKCAFDDHFAERYHASVPLFLIIIDGAVNDYTKSKGFFAEGTDVSAWDCLVGCGDGLTKIKDIFKKGRNKTNHDEIRLPYRNGILHGRDLNYAMPGLLTIGIKIKSYCHAKMNFLTLLIIPMSMRTTHRSNMKRCFAICTRYLPSTKIFLWTTILANCHSEVLPKSILSPKPQSNGD